jgi:hypothetical protein
MLLQGDNDALALLRRQAEQARAASRKMTGVGFFTKFALPPGVPRLPGRQTFKFGDVNGTADNVNHGVGFLLYVDDGALSMLEGYTYDEPWPNELRGLVLKYAEQQGRKLNFLPASSSRN